MQRNDGEKINHWEKGKFIKLEFNHLLYINVSGNLATGKGLVCTPSKCYFPSWKTLMA